MVLAVVLGSAAGGGFPQWNSNASACRRARRGDLNARARSQASLAVSANKRDWIVLNASPDLRLQIEGTTYLHPREELRSSPIAGVVLTGGDVDAIAGLLHLRERHRFGVYAPSRVLGVITANPIFDVLSPDFVRRVELPLDERTELAGASDASGLAVVAFAVPARCPLSGDQCRDRTEREGGSVGIEIIETATESRFSSRCAAGDRRLRRRLANSARLFDGTWRDDEMIRLRSRRPAGAWGMPSMSGADGTIAFRDLGVVAESLSTSTTRTRPCSTRPGGACRCRGLGNRL
jgi:pyrroloquinoline quinone biosynthesis protein B